MCPRPLVHVYIFSKQTRENLILLGDRYYTEVIKINPVFGFAVREDCYINDTFSSQDY